jgi:hypothetical protein
LFISGGGSSEDEDDDARGGGADGITVGIDHFDRLRSGWSPLLDESRLRGVVTAAPSRGDGDRMPANSAVVCEIWSSAGAGGPNPGQAAQRWR